MSELTLHTVETAPEGARQTLRTIESSYGFVPNLMAVLAESPVALGAYTNLSQLFESSSLTPTEQQVVLLTVSFENGCDYCMAAHSTIAAMQRVSDEVVSALRNGETLPDARLEALAALTRQMVRERGWPERRTLDTFFTAGFERAQLLEVVVGVAMKTISNYTNHLATTPVDEAFAATRWTPPGERSETRKAV
jgi:uncharacterized peroxidase-related enzyme